MTDWSATGSMISGLGTWAGIIALIWATQKGRQSLADWRQQKALDREMAIAEEVMTAAYNLNAAIESIRGNVNGLYQILFLHRHLLEMGSDSEVDAKTFKLSVETSSRQLEASVDDREALKRLISIKASAKAMLGEECQGPIAVLSAEFRRASQARSMLRDRIDETSPDEVVPLKPLIESWISRAKIALDSIDIGPATEALAALEAILIPKIRGE